MFQTVAGILILLFISLTGSRKTFVRLRLPFGAKMFFLTGTEFIFIGLILGEPFIALLDRETLQRLGPLFSLGLGYFGLLFGLQFEWEKLRRFSRRFFGAAAIQAGTTLIVVALPFAWMLASGHLALIPGAVACCSSPAMIALVIQETRPPHRADLDLIRYIGGVDTIIGFTVLGLAACMRFPGGLLPGANSLAAFQWMGAAIACGITSGFLLHLLTQVHCKEDELWVFTIGVITFAGGVSLFWGLSPLFVAMVAGMTASNLPGSKDRVFMAIARQEKPFYILFLILAGAVWQPAGWLVFALAAVYLAARTAGKLSGGFLAAAYVGREIKASPWLGAGLMSQSGVAIAVAMELYLSKDPVADLLVAMLITAFVANELLSPPMIYRLVRRTGKSAP